MDINLARQVARSAFRSSRELGNLIPVLKQTLDADEFQIYSKAIATAIATIQVEVVNRVTTAHPGLEAEIEDSIEKKGHF